MEYLKQRGSTYYLRVRVPLTIKREIYNKDEISFSLRTASLYQAKRKAKVYSREIITMLQYAKRDTLTEEQINSLVDTYKRDCLISDLESVLKSDYEYFRGSYQDVKEVSGKAEDTIEPVIVEPIIEKEDLEEPIEKSSKNLENILELFIMEMNTSEIQERDYRSFFKDVLFSLIDPTIPLDRITREDLLKVRQQLQRLPRRNINKYKGMSIKEILAKEIPTEDLISVKNLNKFIKWTTSLFTFAYNHNYIVRNPSINLKVKEHTIAQKERDSFTDEELGKIFKAIKGHPREDIVNVQLYTGMLLSEFLKCKVSEVKGILCFDLRHVQGKTDYRPRLIPIHPYLLSRGIHERLIDLQRHKSASISHWFMDMLRTHVTKSAKKVNYSLRHTFATKLKAKEVSEEIITELMGHSFASMSLSRYAKEYPIEILKTAIDKLEVM